MTSQIKISGNGTRVTISANGKRAGVFISGPNNWVEGVDPATIKIRFKKQAPQEIIDAVSTLYENHTDTRDDYFHNGDIVLLPEHGEIYDMAVKCA